MGQEGGSQMKLCAIDFEFCHPSERDMGLICVAIKGEDFPTETFWLWKGEENKQFLHRIATLKPHYRFVGYSIQQAEARCIAALGTDPNVAMQWRDLMLEWRWLRNGDYRYSYGHVIQGGFPKFTVPPRARVGKKASQAEIDDAEEINTAYLAEVQEDMEEGVTAGLAEAGWTMLDCTYFFGQMTFGEYGAALETKKRVRDGIIIGATDEEIEAHKQEILDYCAADVGDLIPLAHKLTEEMETVATESHMMMLDGEISYVDFEGKVEKIQLNIGAWAARLAKYGLRGIPLNAKRLERLVEIVPQLTEETKWDWNKTFPETPLYRIGYTEEILAMKKQPLKKSPFVAMNVAKDQALLEAFIESHCLQCGITNWPRTRSGQIDTSAKVIEKYAAGENAIKQYQRHQAQMSALKTYAPNAKTGKVEAMDYIGSDFRQRVDFGPFGTQTARNAAKAKSFCFLGPHWIRMLVEPPKDKVIVELDFGSQEVWIAACISDDANLKAAYLSNDVYMYYAQLTGMYPQHLPIPTEEQRSEEWFKPFKRVRSIAKTLNLSMQFGAGAKSVAAAVRSATKDDSIDDEQGSEWVSQYNSAYGDYTGKTRDLRDRYRDGTGIALPTGWRMGKDNMSALSAGNLPVQGLGACILQLACELCDENSLCVIATLHDAITFECDEGDEERVATLATKLMKQAAREVLGVEGMKVGAPEYVRHGHLWLHSEKAQLAWAKLGRYFEDL